MQTFEHPKINVLIQYCTQDTIARWAFLASRWHHAYLVVTSVSIAEDTWQWKTQAVAVTAQAHAAESMFSAIVAPLASAPGL